MAQNINAEIILATLERVAERIGDPTPLVYAELFRQQPDMESMFVMDKDGSVRGHMLSEALDGIIDFIGARNYADNLIRSEIVNHENLGVPPQVFSTFFAVIRDTFRNVLGTDWTSEMETAWNMLLVDITEAFQHQHA